jgi:hypothetical protein
MDPCVTQETVKVKLRKTLIATSFGLALLIMPISAASAQQMQDTTALDGRTLGSESQATQQLFLGTWGQQATERWAAEHDAQLRFAPGEMGTSAQTGQSQGQSGAQTASGAMGQNQSDDEQEGAQSDGNLSNSHQRGGDDDDDQNNQSGANNSDQGGVNNSSQNTGSQSGSNNSDNSGSGQGSSGSNDSGQSNSGQ